MIVLNGDDFQGIRRTMRIRNTSWIVPNFNGRLSNLVVYGDVIWRNITWSDMGQVDYYLMTPHLYLNRGWFIDDEVFGIRMT